MGRIRTLKPELPTDEKLARCSLPARYVFVLTITQADDQGLLRGNPRQLLGSLLPFDENVTADDLAGWLDELRLAGIVRWRETVDGAPVLELKGWGKHQVVNKPSQPRLLNSLRPLSDAPAAAQADSTPESPGDSGKSPESSSADRRSVGPSELGPSEPVPSELLAPTRQPRESRQRVVAGEEPAPSRETWLTEPCAAWESTYGPGTFPMGQAASQLTPLRKAGFSSTEIAVRLAWYLKVRGLDTADPDPEVIARTRFSPSLKDFAQRFGAFDPASGRASSTDAHGPAWVFPGVKAWVAEVGYVSQHEFRRKLTPSVETHGEHTLLVAIKNFGEHRRRTLTLGYAGSLDAFAREYRDYVPGNMIGRPAMAIAPDTSEAA